MNSESIKTALDKEIGMAKRERIRVARAEGDRNRMQEADSLVLWYDSRGVEAAEGGEAILSRISNLRYTGVVLYPETLDRFLGLVSPRLHKILHCADEATWAELSGHPLLQKGGDKIVVASANPAVLLAAGAAGLPTCLRAYVDDAESLHDAIQRGGGHGYLMVAFRDPTNIPLELVIASLQATHTVLIKEITDDVDVDDAVVTLGVMEVGADGVVFSPRTHDLLDRLTARLSAVEGQALRIEVGTVVRSVPVGMGYRSCIDLATLFSPSEGMIVGSTSQGGVLCCPEVFYLPYMELRPFRVNAGAVHSYVYNVGDRTDYMTELRAGAPVMVVDTAGKVRKAVVGRMKTEVRPLRLIEVEFEGHERVNVLMQDDWHVRIFSAEGKPLNITELKPGDKVLGHVAQPGRHVGIKVDEHIVEN